VGVDRKNSDCSITKCRCLSFELAVSFAKSISNWRWCKPTRQLRLKLSVLLHTGQGDHAQGVQVHGPVAHAGMVKADDVSLADGHQAYYQSHSFLGQEYVDKSHNFVGGPAHEDPLPTAAALPKRPQLLIMHSYFTQTMRHQPIHLNIRSAYIPKQLHVCLLFRTSKAAISRGTCNGRAVVNQPVTCTGLLISKLAN